MEVIIALVIFVGLGAYIFFNLKKEAEKDNAIVEAQAPVKVVTPEPVAVQTPAPLPDPVVITPTDTTVVTTPDTVTVAESKPADNTINVKELVAKKKTKPKAKKQPTTESTTIVKPKSKSRSKKSTDKA